MGIARKKKWGVSSLTDGYDCCRRVLTLAAAVGDFWTAARSVLAGNAQNFHTTGSCGADPA